MNVNKINQCDTSLNNEDSDCSVLQETNRNPSHQNRMQILTETIFQLMLGNMKRTRFPLTTSQVLECLSSSPDMDWVLSRSLTDLLPDVTGLPETSTISLPLILGNMPVPSFVDEVHRRTCSVMFSEITLFSLVLHDVLGCTPEEGTRMAVEECVVDNRLPLPVLRIDWGFGNIVYFAIPYECHSLRGDVVGSGMTPLDFQLFWLS